MARHVHGFADKEKAGDCARLHRPRIQVIGVDAPGGDFRFLESLRALGMKLPVAQSPLVRLKRRVRPAGRRARFCNVLRQTLRQ
jgi:hypothetical protein